MSGWRNYDDVLSQLQSLGLVIKSNLVIGKRQRCDTTNSKEKLRGWYHLDTIIIDGDQYIAGAYGYWEGESNNKCAVELSKKCESCGHENPIKAKECASCGKKTFKKNTLSQEQIDALKKQRAEAYKKAEQAQAAEHNERAKLATKAWHQLSKEGNCSYLQRKNISAPAHIRYGNGEQLTFDTVDEFGQPMVLTFSNDQDALILEAKDISGKTWALQIIRGNPSKFQPQKEFWPKGAKMSANFFTIGAPSNVVLIAEGFATAMTLHLATGLQVLVAFNANNMPKVAEAYHKKHPKIKLLICADDDYLVTCKHVLDEKTGNQCNHVSLAGTDYCPACSSPLFRLRDDGSKEHKGRAGEKYAEAAAIAVGGAWVKPSFETDREGKKLTDFNDLANYGAGTESTVMVQIEGKLAQLGWVSHAPSAPRVSAYQWGGGGERKAAVSVMEVEDLCERYIPIDDGTGEAVFDTWTNRVVGKKQMLALMPAGAKLDDIKRNYLWQSRGAFYLDDIGFDPTEKDNKVKLNLWTGWELKPKTGNCELLLQTLEYMCSKESNADELLWWIIKWMAYPLQNPGAKMASAVIMHGPQGTGKSLIFRTLAKVYGKYASVIGNSGIEDKFNADWSDSKLYILAEEIATSADKWQIKNELKELITGETVRVRAMHRIAYHQKNHMNIVFLSNEDLPIPIEQDDRRHCVVYTPASLPKEHYTQVLEDLDSGGVEAFYDFLMNIDLTGFNRHTQPPQSQAKKNLISLSLPSDRRFIKEWSEGYLKQPICPCKSMSLYKAYISWCKSNGETRPRPSNQFLGMVTNLTGWIVDRKRFFESTHYTGKLSQASVVIPSSEILSKNGYEKPFNKTEQQWLTDYILDFENANNDQNAEF